MNTKAKVLIPNKAWILEEKGIKLGTLNREKIGYSFFRKGKKLELHSLNEVKTTFGVEIFKDVPQIAKKSVNSMSIYDFPCGNRPYNPVYNLRQKLPIYAKSAKSKSLYCAGYYIIQFRKGWVKSFCPKLITLERYPYQGPFKTEQEMKTILNQVNKNETT